MDKQGSERMRPPRPAIASDAAFAAQVEAIRKHAAVRRADEHERANRDKWWIDPDDDMTGQPSPQTEQNDARDAGRGIAEEERILTDGISGMKATPEGTAGRDGTMPPRDDKARPDQAR